ncbi:MAG: hypothetical protein ACYTG6_01310 [Planctomycetota bacterium]|jgi:hypothetical protein
MREFPALVLRHLRAALRGRGARTLAIAAVITLGGTLLLPSAGTAAASTLILVALLLTGVFAFGTAAASGTLLPADRIQGREEWLATLAPPGVQRRLATAVAGMLLALGVALASAVIVGLVLGAGGRGPEVRAAAPLPAFEGTLLPAGDGTEGHAVVVVPGAGGGPRTLEVRLAPRYLRESATNVPAEVAWTMGGEQGRATPAHGAPFRLDLPPDVETVALASASPDIALVVREARLLEGARSLFASLLLAGVLLGVGAASLAPIAVAVSRWTSGATAVTAPLVLVLAGGLRPLLADVPTTSGDWAQRAGLEVVRFASRLAPDMSALSVLAEPGAGRALSAADLGAALPLLLYAVAGLVLVLLPFGSRALREGRA